MKNAEETVIMLVFLMVFVFLFGMAFGAMFVRYRVDTHPECFGLKPIGEQANKIF